MTLRTSALVAGALGLVLLVVGLIADANRVSPIATPSTDVASAVVVVTPEVATLAPGGRVSVSGTGAIEAHTARTADADAWVGLRSATYVTGLPTWEELSTRNADRVQASPSPSPTPSGSASPSPSPTPSPSPSAQAEEPAAIERGSQDVWRDTWRGTDRLSVAVDDVPAGLTLVFESVDGSPLASADLRVDRDVADGWITPLIWWGVALAVVGLIALAFLVLDLRPVQARLETWMARRGRIGSGTAEPTPGSRRARRQAGVSMPVAEFDDGDSDGAVPDESATDAQDREGDAAPDDDANEGGERA